MSADCLGGLERGANALRERPLVVLKFGSSVLSSPDRVHEAVTEIYRCVRAGRRVVAVASAFAGVTDALLEKAEAFGCPHDNVNAPAYVAIGEETAAALLALACDRAGLCAIALKAPQLGILATGPIDAATPIGFSPHALESALKSHDVVIAPGFVATDEKGRTVLLGRGGSDLSAVFLAHALGAERVRLVKDVDGVYDCDPNADNDALRFSRVDWRTARDLAGTLVQPRALDFACAHGLDIEVAALGSTEATIVGRSFAPAEPPRRRRKLRVALAGCGVVGTGVARRLIAQQDKFEISAVLVRDAGRERAVGLAPEVFTSVAANLLESGADVLVDVLSCGRTGASLSEAALARGIHVVSANKQAIVGAFDKLHKAASARHGRILYSAAVGGGAPLLETVALARGEGAKITLVEGIFNGTVNFLLEQLAGGASFAGALEKAQAAGLAEEDPTADLTGADAAAKLKLVSIAAFDRLPDEIVVTPLDQQEIKLAGATLLKQVGRLIWRHERLVGEISFEHAETANFPGVGSDRNAIRLHDGDGRTFSARGRGAGRWPTTESVFADLVDLAAQLSHFER